MEDLLVEYVDTHINGWTYQWDLVGVLAEVAENEADATRRLVDGTPNWTFSHFTDVPALPDHHGVLRYHETLIVRSAVLRDGTNALILALHVRRMFGSTAACIVWVVTRQAAISAHVNVKCHPFKVRDVVHRFGYAVRLEKITTLDGGKMPVEINSAIRTNHMVRLKNKTVTDIPVIIWINDAGALTQYYCGYHDKDDRPVIAAHGSKFHIYSVISVDDRFATLDSFLTPLLDFIASVEHPPTIDIEDEAWDDIDSKLRLASIRGFAMRPPSIYRSYWFRDALPVDAGEQRRRGKYDLPFPDRPADYTRDQRYVVGDEHDFAANDLHVDNLDKVMTRQVYEFALAKWLNRITGRRIAVAYDGKQFFFNGVEHYVTAPVVLRRDGGIGPPPESQVMRWRDEPKFLHNVVSMTRAVYY